MFIWITFQMKLPTNYSTATKVKTVFSTVGIGKVTKHVLFYLKYILFPTGIITTMKLICLQCSKFSLDVSTLASHPCHLL